MRSNLNLSKNFRGCIVAITLLVYGAGIYVVSLSTQEAQAQRSRRYIRKHQSNFKPSKYSGFRSFKNRRYYNSYLDIMAGGGYHLSFTNGYNYSLTLNQTFKQTGWGYQAMFRYAEDSYKNIFLGYFPKPLFTKHAFSLNVGVYNSLRHIIEKKKVLWVRQWMKSLFDFGYAFGAKIHYQVNKETAYKKRIEQQHFLLSRVHNIDPNTNKFETGVYAGFNMKLFFVQNVYVFASCDAELLIYGINDERRIGRGLQPRIVGFFTGGVGVLIH